MAWELPVCLINQLLTAASHFYWVTLFVELLNFHSRWEGRDCFLAIKPISLLLHKALFVADIEVHGLLFQSSHAILEYILMLLLNS